MSEGAHARFPPGGLDPARPPAPPHPPLFQGRPAPPHPPVGPAPCPGPCARAWRHRLVPGSHRMLPVHLKQGCLLPPRRLQSLQVQSPHGRRASGTEAPSRVRGPGLPRSPLYSGSGSQVARAQGRSALPRGALRTSWVPRRLSAVRWGSCRAVLVPLSRRKGGARGARGAGHGKTHLPWAVRQHAPWAGMEAEARGRPGYSCTHTPGGICGKWGGSAYEPATACTILQRVPRPSEGFSDIKQGGHFDLGGCWER